MKKIIATLAMMVATATPAAASKNCTSVDASRAFSAVNRGGNVSVGDLAIYEYSYTRAMYYQIVRAHGSAAFMPGTQQPNFQRDRAEWISWARTEMRRHDRNGDSVIDRYEASQTGFINSYHPVSRANGGGYCNF